MAGDAAGSDPDESEDRPEGDDGSPFEWGVAEPEHRDGPRFSTDETKGDGRDGPDRIPMNLGGRDEQASTFDDPETGDDEGQKEDAIGPEPGSAPIEREELCLENVVFVLLGAITMILVLVRLVSLGF